MSERETKLLEQLVKAQASTSARIWDIATKLAVPAVAALITWMWAHERTLAVHETRLEVIESNRFTTASGMELERRLNSTIVEALNRQTAALNAMVERLAKVEAKLEGLDK